MKNISVALNVVLIIAVAVLYYLHFKKPVGESGDATSPVVFSANATIPTSIVYVNTDSLLHNFSFYKTSKSDFEAKQARIERDLKAESERLQSDAEAYQQKGGMMTESERAKTEEQLMMRQQSLMKKKDDMVEKLDAEQAKFSDELYSKLTDYLKEYNKGKNYTYILGYQKGGGILFANDSLDVTAQILEGLNKSNEAK
jgi:outer membrane protein